MEWDEKEANDADVIDARDGSSSSAGGAGIDLGSVLGGILGGATSGGGGGIQLPTGGSAGGSAMRPGRGKGGLAMMLVLGVVALFLLPKILGSSGNFLPPGMGQLDQLPGAQQGNVVPSGATEDQRTGIPAGQDPDAQLRKFAGVIITDTNNVWEQQFKDAGKSYSRTKLALYDGEIRTACGPGSSEMGPFYCPGDSIVYIDLGFFQELSKRFGAAGDFAQAYVIAHEVGHHVQNQLGISDQVHTKEQDEPDLALGPESLSVRLELQADCLAGVWANSRRERGLTDSSKALDDGDFDEALTAASGVGDDTIQRQATGEVHPEQFSHGTSEQRRRWFSEGFNSGNSDSCNTFETDQL